MQRLRPGRVAAAHERQRLWCTDQEIRANAKANGTLLEEIAAPDNEGRTLLNQAADHMKLSGRGYNRILRIARTSAAKTVYAASASRKPYRIAGSRRADKATKSPADPPRTKKIEKTVAAT